MTLISGKVILATRQTSSVPLEELRKNAYRNSQNFKILDDNELTNYSRWSQKDETGIVLLAVDQAGEALATLRGNVRFSLEELIKYNDSFNSIPVDFCSFPTLDLTFAATAPCVFKTGLNSVLRYYMYELHHLSIKSILGTCVKNSSIHKTLVRLDYDCQMIDKSWASMESVDTWMIAQLPGEKIDDAIAKLKAEYQDVIMRFPLIIT